MTPPLLYFILLAPTAADELPVAPDVAKAIITDHEGLAISDKIALGECIKFSAKKSIHGTSPTSIKWLIEPSDRDAAKWVPDCCGGVSGIVPVGMKPVEITITLVVAKGDSVDIHRIRVRAGEGDIPPPGPEPKPEPDPQPVARKLFVAVIHSTGAITPDEAIVLGDSTFWDGLVTRGHSYRRYDFTMVDPVMAVINQNVNLSPRQPVVVLMDESKSKVLLSFPLPKNTSAIDAEIKRFSSR